MGIFALKLIVAATALVAVCDGQNTTCGENQVFNNCGTACPDYCYKDDSKLCTMQCKIGCECAPGFKQEYVDSNNCVNSCEKAQKCSANKTFYTCGSACPAYCGQPQPVKCTKNCVQECQCKPGYVKQSQTSSNCIPKAECPA